MSKKIFLSYRQTDSQDKTRNIHDKLEQDGHAPFMDASSIPPGELWPETIKTTLVNADIVIAVIGPNWLRCQDEAGRRRIDKPNDWVRCELRTALQKGKKIIPVLIDDAKMPSRQDLPDDLMDFADIQARCIISGSNWDESVNALLDIIERPMLPKAILVLTSESPRREELLRSIGWRRGGQDKKDMDYFSVHASISPCAKEDDTHVNKEEEKRSLTLEEAKRIAEKTACKKINWVSEHPDQIWHNLDPSYGWIRAQTVMIGVDTIVFCGNKILDRPLLSSLELAGPLDRENARKRAKEMLMEQRGQQIHIITGLAVKAMGGHRPMKAISVVTEAKLRYYSESDIDNYIACSEPLDKAGAFGIQGKGVSLFKHIKGSYTNVVGLPLLEFMDLLEGICKDAFTLPEMKSSLAGTGETPSDCIGSVKTNANLSVVCVGDINYDFIYDKTPDIFADIKAPGKKFINQIHRAVGGTAVNFAKGAKAAGFFPCYVVGVVGGDALGTQIVNELHALDIIPIYRHDPNVETSIAIILRDLAQEDTSLTLTDAHQSLPDAALSLASGPIAESDVFYCSGYCLTDPYRRTNALKLLHGARDAHRLVVLDVVVGMSKKIPLNELTNTSGDDNTCRLVDVVVSEMPEIFDWFDIPAAGENELEVWARHQETLAERLRRHFQVAILRTSRYTHEVVVTPNGINGPAKLDYSQLNARQKTGYGDFRTAKQVHSFLSPRIVLASKSPQRHQLLSQIITPSKIQIVASACEEAKQRETPHERVQRLAQEKAESVFKNGKFHGDIELIIGADTEIIFQDSGGNWTMIGHPKTTEEAQHDLVQLNNRVHIALTGIAIIGKDPDSGRLKKIVTYDKTQVIFIKASDAQLQKYAETGEPIGRAGAYAIQGLGTMLIKSIEGSYSNVVGLPLEKLSQILADEFGKPIWDFDKVSKWRFPDPIKALSHDDTEWRCIDPAEEVCHETV